MPDLNRLPTAIDVRTGATRTHVLFNNGYHDIAQRNAGAMMDFLGVTR
ncbi:hypothetical protein [Paraburkholderia antibiotica]|uniref:Uncharacterized protein n=1 Tax=Paraburkholderia antibiotica TaxID=2728839 RepID=A0A7X9X260_9BURK|nr:hypothetical protein [Paraburkholderia antibiotica]NML30047.1 hypothetical protein [Paraburkholderia antibiotica]